MSSVSQIKLLTIKNIFFILFISNASVDLIINEMEKWKSSSVLLLTSILI